ncbi:hypothetical protein TRVL_04409 [Trypanosoma vivax]|nr:hypothetical protein TRVL_04409 [Trypanosoma vivax]
MQNENCKPRRYEIRRPLSIWQKKPAYSHSSCFSSTACCCAARSILICQCCRAGKCAERPFVLCAFCSFSSPGGTILKKTAFPQNTSGRFSSLHPRRAQEAEDSAPSCYMCSLVRALRTSQGFLGERARGHPRPVNAFGGWWPFSGKGYAGRRPMPLTFGSA